MVSSIYSRCLPRLDSPWRTEPALTSETASCRCFLSPSYLPLLQILSVQAPEMSLNGMCAMLLIS